MTSEAGTISQKRRTSAEIEQIVSEFEGSGLNRSEFCRRHGMAWGTLNGYLKRMRGEASGGSVSGGLVAVELAETRTARNHESGSGLAVVLSSGRWIAVNTGFDVPTLQRIVQALEMR